MFVPMMVRQRYAESRDHLRQWRYSAHSQIAMKGLMKCDSKAVKSV